MQRVIRLPRWRLPGWRLLALTTLLVLLPLAAIVACGGEEPDTPTPPTVTPTATPAPPPADTPEPTAMPEPTATTAQEPTEPPTEAPEPTDMPAPTEEPQPTETPPTPEPTATPEPTPTPEPSATPEPTATPEPAEQPDVSVVPCEGSTGGELGDCAPELAGTQEWINSAPLTMESLQGKVVLIDFWTYSCINCIRTIPFLQTWHERYADDGLVILGVHTPEFEFEKNYDNVVQATEEMGVAWPVVQDNDFTVWRSYSNRFWPAKYLIDINGEIRFRHFGEGRYPETEQAIRELLQERGAATEALAAPLPTDQQQDQAYARNLARRTPELFTGWRFTESRGGIGQTETYNAAATQSYRAGDQEGVVAEFVMPAQISANLIYFNGPWSIGPESAVHARVTEDYSDDVILAYSARSVNAVLGSESGEPYTVGVRVNGEYLTEENKGEDIVIDEDGESHLMVTSHRAYKIVEHPEFQQFQILQMFSKSDDFSLYSFTFGTYEDGF